MVAYLRENRVLVIVYLILIGIFVASYQGLEPQPLSQYLYSGDVWEYHHDYYYRSGLDQIFDFRHKTKSLGSSTYYQPISALTFNIFFPLAKINDFILHHVGMFMHCLNGLFVGILALMMRQKKSIAIIAAGVFLLHPFNVLTVSQIPSILTHPIAAMFYLLCILCFVQNLKIQSKGWSCAALFFFVLACLVKVYVLMIIPVLMMLDILNAVTKSKTSLWTWMKRENWLFWSQKYLPYAAISFIFVSIAIYNQPRGAIAHYWGDASVNLFSVLRFLDYMTINYLPFLLKSNYSIVYVLGVILILSTLFIRRHLKIKIMILWTCLSFLMFVVSNYRPIETLHRYFYAASIPTAIFFGMMIEYILKRVRDYASHR